MLSFQNWRNLSEEVTPDQVNKIERYVDTLFQKYNITVRFSDHFYSQVNNSRNNPTIKASEVVDLFNKEFKEHGKEISSMQVGDEGLMRDLSSDLNLPIGIHWDRNKRMLQLKTITIMRKRNFGNDNFNDKLLAVK